MDKKLLANSTKWSAISEVIVKLASPIANIILARLLAPEIFGLVATFTVVTSFAEVFTDGGFQKYLIQHEFDNAKEMDQCINVAFWTNFTMSLLFWLVIFLFRENVAELVGSSGYGIEITVLSFQIPLFAFSSIQQALYRRDFKFKELAPIRLISSLTPLFVTVPIAFFLKNCWAVIIGSIVRELVNAVLLMRKSSWKPSFFYSFKKLREMLPACLWLMADSFMIWATTYAGTLIVSHSLSTEYLGIYRTGTTTITQYLNILATITQPVIFSALSRCQNNREECNKVYVNYLKYVAYIAFPIGTCIGLHSDLVTTILLGQKWMEAGTVIACLSFTFPWSLLTGQFNSYYFRALGKPHISLFVQTIYTVIMIMLFRWAVSKSFFVFSIVAGCIGLVYMIISNAVLFVCFRFPYYKMLRGWIPSIIGSIAMIIGATLLRMIGGSGIIIQVISVVLSLSVYAVVIMMIPFSRKDLLENGIKSLFK